MNKRLLERATKKAEAMKEKCKNAQFDLGDAQWKFKKIGQVFEEAKRQLALAKKLVKKTRLMKSKYQTALRFAEEKAEQSDRERIESELQLEKVVDTPRRQAWLRECKKNFKARK